MSELKREVLLNILEAAFRNVLRDIHYKDTRTRYEQAKKQIKALIQKPGITEEWIEEKAREFMKDFGMKGMTMIDYVKDFIRSLVEEEK